jgi:hypothetical protein
MEGQICCSYVIKCPSNRRTDNNQYSIPVCYSNNQLPICEHDYTLKIIIVYGMNTIYCFPDWLY